jgi:hypothetical protein
MVYKLNKNNPNQIIRPIIAATFLLSAEMLTASDARRKSSRFVGSAGRSDFAIESHTGSNFGDSPTAAGDHFSQPQLRDDAFGGV